MIAAVFFDVWPELTLVAANVLLCGFALYREFQARRNAQREAGNGASH